MAKRDGIKSFLKRAKGYGKYELRTRPLEECFDAKIRDNRIASNIGTAIVETYDDYMTKKVPKVVDNAELSSMLVEELKDLIDKMDVSPKK